MSALQPMLVSDSNESDLSKFEGTWLLEEKLDGERMQAIKKNSASGRIKLFSRNLDKFGNYKENTNTCPEIIEALEQVSSFSSFHLDGEILHKGEGTSEENFLKTCSRMRMKIPDDSAVKDTPLSFFVFDCIEKNDIALFNQTVQNRKFWVDQIVSETGKGIYPVESFQHNFNTHYQNIIEKGGEGVVLKKAGSNYVCGANKDWIRILPEKTADVICYGLTKGNGRNEKYFGAFKCKYNGAEFNVGPGRLGYSGMQEVLDNLASEKLVFPFVVEAFYKGILPSGKLRMPRAHRIRYDKTVEEEERKVRGQASLSDF